MNRLRKQLGAVFLGMAVMFSSVQQVGAGNIGSAPALAGTEEETGNADNAGVEGVKDSVVQIVTEYVADNGTSYILKSGSGFLIGEGTVLTDYQLLALTDEEKAAAEVYLSGELGVPVSFGEVEGAQTITTRLGVVMYRDVVLSAEINPYSSREMRLGILNLSEPLSRSTAVLGDSSAVSSGRELYAVGYKTVAVMLPGEEAARLSQRDIKVSQGTAGGAVTEANLIYLSHGAKISRGLSGGPTVDENGLVVGMNLYGGFEDGSYRTLAVNEIKELLKSCDIPYQESGLSSISAEDIAEAREPEPGADTELLDDYILNYSLIEKSGYTEESYQALEEALAEARNIKNDRNATAEEVTHAVEQLSAAKAGLVPKKNINYPFLITLGILILAVITGLVLYILKLKGVLFRKPEPEKIWTLDEMNLAAKIEPEIVMPKPKNSGSLGKGGESGGYKETTVLGVENPAFSEGTVVLGSQLPVFEAYLLRKSNGEKIRVNGNEFLIGKDKSRVSYCISDNPSISRCHAKIGNRNMKYYLSDMQSTNFTYLNGRIVAAGEEAELKDGDSLRFSNEEYLFSIRKGD